uniref:Protein kinase domain-containing protein n=1 Tax=Oryza punctata TaxID=4537 RepID=A0A0E0JLS5_ORYPU
MTEDFRCMVGRGGSATVFRGVLDDGTAVAVKRIACDESVGYCITTRWCACSDTASSLAAAGTCCIHSTRTGHSTTGSSPARSGGVTFRGRRGATSPSTSRRGSPTCTTYEFKNRILHLDIKPTNILLDGEFRAHVSDFGISMSVGRDLTSVDTRGRGTLGYMAPEMLVNALSSKSDVYSYGMMLFELVGGPARAPRRDRMAEGRLMEVVDATMALGGVDEEEVEVVVKVAFCISRDMRPGMTDVVDMLEGCAPVPPPPVRPEFLGDTFPVSCARTAMSR